MARNPESLFWDRVKPLLAGFHPKRIECEDQKGVPDVNCSLGWIELKQKRKADMPKRVNTPVRLDHFTPEQRAWLAGRANVGGACWLLLLMGDEWLLFDGMVAALHVGKVPAGQLRQLACAAWGHTPSRTGFITALKRTMPK